MSDDAPRAAAVFIAALQERLRKDLSATAACSVTSLSGLLAALRARGLSEDVSVVVAGELTRGPVDVVVSDASLEGGVDVIAASDLSWTAVPAGDGSWGLLPLA